MLLSRQPVLHTHDELYMQTLIDESAVHKPSCTVDVGSKISIAGSTLSFRICVAKPSTSGAILMNFGREVHGAGRGHVRFEVKSASTRCGVPSATASRKLNDHLGIVFAHALLHLSKQDAIGSRGFIRLAHVDVNEGGTRIE